MRVTFKPSTNPTTIGNLVWMRIATVISFFAAAGEGAMESVIKSEPVTENGVAFVGRATEVWTVRDDQPTEIEIALLLTNNTRRPTRFWIMDRVEIGLSDAEGTAVPCDGGRNQTRPGKAISELIDPGDTLEIAFRGKLTQTERGKRWTLRGDDGFGGTWIFKDLRPGAYHVQLHYRNDKAGRDASEPLWIGEVATLPVVVMVGPESSSR